MKHPTEQVNGTEMPTPGKWSCNWVEGDVVSWRHDPDPDAKIHDGSTAHVFVVHDGDFGTPEYRVEVNGERVERIRDADSITDALDRVGDILIEHTP